MWVRIQILLVWCVAATHGWARDIYVDNVAGDDRYDGNAPVAAGDPVGPYRTITSCAESHGEGRSRNGGQHGRGVSRVHYVAGGHGRADTRAHHLS